MSAHASLVSAAVSYLRLNGIWAVAINQVARRRRDGSYHSPGAPAGVPDIMACVPPGGHMIGLEIKTGAGKLRTEQSIALADMARHGATVKVIRNVAELVPLVASLRALERALTR